MGLSRLTGRFALHVVVTTECDPSEIASRLAMMQLSWRRAILHAGASLPRSELFRKILQETSRWQPGTYGRWTIRARAAVI